MIRFYEKEQSVWESLSKETRPIVLYGMGDGADKILSRFDKLGIKASAVFASDEFVRGQSFHNMRVQHFSDVAGIVGEDFIIVIAFASQRPEVLEKMYALDAKFDVVAPDVPVIGGGTFDTEFAKQNNSELNTAYELLSDEHSKRVFMDTVKFKLSGRLRYLRDSETSRGEALLNILRPTDYEHFVDLGAYNGDTLRELLAYTNGAFSSITALEPDKRNFRKLAEYVEKNLAGNIKLLQAGAWSSDTKLKFAAKAGRQSRISKEGAVTTMRSLDSVLDGKPCSMLKIDIEGAEHEALKGAENTIRKYSPKLNVSVYHRNEDLFSIPIQIYKICPKYMFFLRHHPYVPSFDTNLYCIPAKSKCL